MVGAAMARPSTILGAGEPSRAGPRLAKSGRARLREEAGPALKRRLSEEPLRTDYSSLVVAVISLVTVAFSTSNTKVGLWMTFAAGFAVTELTRL